MCGITGYIDFSRQTSQHELCARATRMADQIRYRGPDDQGVWADPEAGIVLSHQRLSIIDTTESGHQPMVSSCGRYVMIYNGEIYNFREIREQLLSLGVYFRGYSDTEVLLAAFSNWGLEKTLESINGMFSIALWNREARCLHLIRDRLGQKPLYYAWMGDVFLFGSELKSLKAHPSFIADIDRGSLASYLRMNYIPAPASIYKNTFKLLPATYLTISSPEKNKAPVLYWDQYKLALKTVDKPFTGSEEEAEYILHHLLRDSVGKRMISDVPLGAFLSGGIDSSLVVALMQSLGTKPAKTFTIGFYENQFNEANESRAVAAHLGTDHTELYVTPKQAMEVIPKLPGIYDEPFSDMSQIPTYLVSQFAKQQVTVALSGDGGDEFFGGYNRHFWVPMFWRRFGRMPYFLKLPFLKAMTSVSAARWNHLASKVKNYLPENLRVPNMGDKGHRLASMLSSRSQGDMYIDLVSSWKEPNNLMLDGEEQSQSFFTDFFSHSELSLSHQMMYLDATTYLPDDILTKVDRASMAVSLEARSPLLDYRVVEFAWGLNLSLKIRKNKGKYLLRKILNQYLPNHLIDRPKMGFGVPIGDWLRGPLVPWVENLLDERSLRDDGFFNVSEVRKKWKQHKSGQRNWQYCLWNILMFQLYQEAQTQDGP